MHDLGGSRPTCRDPAHREPSNAGETWEEYTISVDPVPLAGTQPTEKPLTDRPLTDKQAHRELSTGGTGPSRTSPR